MSNNINGFHIQVAGFVQGVGFRPFVFNLAREMNLNGKVGNDSVGAFIEIIASEDQLNIFLERLKKEKPEQCTLEEISVRCQFIEDMDHFIIETSQKNQSVSSTILPDLATCKECLQDIRDSENSRFAYPFTNCTQCGPRYSIIKNLPYDRLQTTMSHFVMCKNCQSEYDNPKDRRFHAQPNACSVCGPQLSYYDQEKHFKAEKNEALILAANAILEGKIIAIKGVGGFHLVCDARNEKTIELLRKRKKRPSKPFAVMVTDLEMANSLVKINKKEREVLTSSQAPIVLLEHRSLLPELIAPFNPELGVMLPYSPLHHLLLGHTKCPLIMTSANISDETIVFEDDDAFIRLEKIVDAWLIHDRPIYRAMEDSVVRVVEDKILFIRRSRGYAPICLPMPGCNTLAMGGHLKNTFAFRKDGKVIVSQYLGDLENKLNIESYKKEQEKLIKTYEFKPEVIVHDLHPDYYSTQLALEQKRIKTYPIQHHVAHFMSAIHENNLTEDCLGVVWDGTGLGSDGNIWGGEFFTLKDRTVNRFASFRQFSLPGGESCSREGWRVAAALTYELGPKFQIDGEHYKQLYEFIRKKINTPLCSSVGRLFDGVSSLLNISHHSSFEAETAMLLEFHGRKNLHNELYPYELTQEENLITIDWRPTIEKIFFDKELGKTISNISGNFHFTLAAMIENIVQESKLNKVVLSGGCFQNRLLLDLVLHRLKKRNVEVFLQRNLPPNDGGICLGQIKALEYEICV